MAFPLPSGLVAQPHGEVADDAGVQAIEAAQASGTRMLVALAFPLRWPGFGWSADQADWAARHIGGLQPWPELERVIIPDPDGEAVWWIAYLSSPAWWMVIIAAIGVFILAAIAVRVVWTVLPQEARPPLELFFNLLPFLVVMVVVMVVVMAIMPVMREIAPPLVEKVKRKVPGG